MNNVKVLIFSVVLMQLMSVEVSASVDVEIDPATYVFKGDSLHLKYTADSMPHWRWGLGTYSMEMPDVLIDVNEKNKHKNWAVEIERAYGLFVEHYFDSSQDGWFVGGQISQQKFQIENPKENSLGFTNGLLMMNLGYKWKVKESGFYLLPWAGIGYTKTINNKNERMASDFDVNPVVAFATVHLGYEF